MKLSSSIAMEDGGPELSRFVVDGGRGEPSNANQMIAGFVEWSIPSLTPARELPLAGESKDETPVVVDLNGTTGSDEFQRRRTKSSSPTRRRSSGGRSKSPGTRRAVKKTVRGEGEDGLGSTHNKLGNGSNHSRRTSVGAPTGPRISWKSDPKASFCDWRIEVHHLTKKGDSVAMDIYNIHRNVVGYGPRKSNFMMKEFFRQIEDRNYGSGANITKIELPFWQAEAFPMVLDFMYDTKEVRQTLTAERACSVFKIAELMEIPPLEDAIENFYRKTLSLKNMTEFMVAATKAKADRLLFASRSKIGSLILEKPELAGLLLPKFMIDILEVNREQVQEIQYKTPERYPDELKLAHSRMWSRAAFVCASHNTKYMTKQIFDAMMHEDRLPAIDVTVAFKLLLLDAKFDPDSMDYKNLHERCVTSITADLEGFRNGFSSPEEMSREIDKLPSPVLADILVKSINQ